MALIACPECGNQMSSTANACPACGRPAAPLPETATMQVSPPAMVSPPSGPIQAVSQVVNVQVSQPVKRWSPVLAALLSFLIPGLGQLYKGQVFNAIVWLIVVVIGYIFFIVPGIVLHIFCVIGALTGNPYK